MQCLFPPPKCFQKQSTKKECQFKSHLKKAGKETSAKSLKGPWAYRGHHCPPQLGVAVGMILSFALQYHGISVASTPPGTAGFQVSLPVKPLGQAFLKEMGSFFRHRISPRKLTLEKHILTGCETGCYMLRSLCPKIGGFPFAKSSQYCGSCDGKVFKMCATCSRSSPKTSCLTSGVPLTKSLVSGEVLRESDQNIAGMHVKITRSSAFARWQRKILKVD